MAAILVVTGASGAGKTASVESLAGRELPGVRCFHFDSIGVPDPAEMARAHGSGEGWQAAATEAWIARLAAEDAEVAVLDGQTRHSYVHAALGRAGNPPARIVLLDCGPEERMRRLSGPRGQPELASPHMIAWAAYLRGQADALGDPVIDTTAITPEAVAMRLAEEISRLREAAAARRESG